MLLHLLWFLKYQLRIEKNISTFRFQELGKYYDLLYFFLLLAIAVSRDHKPDQTDERQRIEDAGGFVMWAGKVILLLALVI